MATRVRRKRPNDAESTIHGLSLGGHAIATAPLILVRPFKPVQFSLSALGSLSLIIEVGSASSGRLLVRSQSTLASGRFDQPAIICITMVCVSEATADCQGLPFPNAH